MTWYRASTVTLANGSPTVTGSGTAFIANVQIGDAFNGPDGRTYEIGDVVSNTVLTLAEPYYGASGAGQSYAVTPTQSYVRDLASAATGLLTSFATVRDGIGAGLMQDGSVASPGMRFANDQDTGIVRTAANTLSLVTSGVERFRIDGDANVLISANATVNGRIRSGSGQTVFIDSAFTDGASYKNWLIGTTYFDGANYQTLNFGSNPVAMVSGGNSGVMIHTSPSGGNFQRGNTPAEVADMVRVRVSNDGKVSVGGGHDAQNVVDIKGAGHPTWGGRIIIGDSGGFNPYVDLARWTGTAADYHLNRISANQGFAFMTANAAAFGAHSLTSRFEIQADGIVRPGSDNVQTLGHASYRWSIVYAGTGTINTSDEREKQQIGAIPDAWLDAWGAVEWKRFKFNDAVAAKGDDARWHLGGIAQQVHAAFAAEGLDAFEIGLCCFDEWEAQQIPTAFDEEGQPTAFDTVPAGDRWGLRYEECLVLEAAYQRRRMADIEARLAALEAA